MKLIDLATNTKDPKVHMDESTDQIPISVENKKQNNDPRNAEIENKTDEMKKKQLQPPEEARIVMGNIVPQNTSRCNGIAMNAFLRFVNSHQEYEKLGLKEADILVRHYFEKKEDPTEERLTSFRVLLRDFIVIYRTKDGKEVSTGTMTYRVLIDF